MKHLKQFLAEQNDTPAPTKPSKANLPTFGSKQTSVSGSDEAEKKNSPKPSYGGRSEKPFKKGRPVKDESNGKDTTVHIEDESEGGNGEQHGEILGVLDQLTGMVKQLLGMEKDEARARHDAEADGDDSNDESPTFMQAESVQATPEGGLTCTINIRPETMSKYLQYCKKQGVGSRQAIRGLTKLIREIESNPLQIVDELDYFNI